MMMASAQGYGKGKNKDEFRKWCEERVQAAYEEISDRIHGDTIKIWRAITLPVGEKPNPNQHPGVCWTWDFGALHPAHGTIRDQIWVFSAETEIDQIDWEQTLAQNATPAYEGEREIRLLPFGRLDDITTDENDIK